MCMNGPNPKAGVRLKDLYLHSQVGLAWFSGSRLDLTSVATEQRKTKCKNEPILSLTAQHQLILTPPHLPQLPHLRRVLDGLQQGTITRLQHYYPAVVLISNQQSLILLREQQPTWIYFLPSHFTLHFLEHWPCVTGHYIHCTNRAEGHSIVWVRQITWIPHPSFTLNSSTCCCETFSATVQLMIHYY